MYIEEAVKIFYNLRALFSIKTVQIPVKLNWYYSPFKGSLLLLVALWGKVGCMDFGTNSVQATFYIHIIT